MDANYRNFYRNFYRRTGGFVPTKPLNQAVLPGDFFQIRNGETVFLGNIFRNGIIDAGAVKLEYGTRLNPGAWNFNDGVTKPYSGRGTGTDAIGGETSYSKQIIAFKAKGSFWFRGHDPESIKILNWSELAEQLIIKMTQTFYSFRELYIVTETATLSDWTLAISAAENAEIELVADTGNFEMIDVFGNSSAKVIQSKDLEYYHRETKRKPVFYKAKKLAVREEVMNDFMTGLIKQQETKNQWANDFYGGNFDMDKLPVSDLAQASAIDMMKSGELSSNTALLYFMWTDMNLDDIERYFMS